MLVALWSAKGGSGTSVFTAACALVLARDAHDADHACGVRVADLAGDLPAIFGLGADPARRARSTGSPPGPRLPPTRSTGSCVEVAPGIALLPRGRSGSPGGCPRSARAGAALAVALREARPRRSSTAARRRDPASRAVVEVADVVRRRAARLLPRAPTRGARLRRSRRPPRRVLLEEPGRSLSANDVSEVLDLPVLARVPVKPPIARAVDAGVLATRLPEPLARAANDLLRRLDPPWGPERRRRVTLVGDPGRPSPPITASSSSASTGGWSPTERDELASPRDTAVRGRLARAAPRRAAAALERAVRRAARRAHPRGRRPRAARAAPRRSDRHRGDDQRSRPGLRRASGRLEPVALGLDARGDRPPRRTGRRTARPPARPVVADGRRPPPRRLPAARGDPAARGRRAVRHHPPIRCAGRHARATSASTGTAAAVLGAAVAARMEPPRRGRDQRGQDHAAQHACRRRSRTPSASSPSRRPRSCGSRNRTWCGSRPARPMPRASAGSTVRDAGARGAADAPRSPRRR